jgi:hypothetical protein
MLMDRYPSGQREQTVNLPAYAFEGSNPSLSTIMRRDGRVAEGAPLLREYGVKPIVSSNLTLSAINYLQWKGGRAAECTGLENRSTGNCTVGSNPTLSAILCGELA